MTDQATMPEAKADPSTLTLEFRHAHGLIEEMLDQVAAGQVTPTGDDAKLFAMVELLKPKGGEPRDQARQQAFDTMTAEADRRSEGEGERAPDRIEQTHQATLRALQEALEQQEAGGDGQAAS